MRSAIDVNHLGATSPSATATSLAPHLAHRSEIALDRSLEPPPISAAANGKRGTPPKHRGGVPTANSWDDARAGLRLSAGSPLRSALVASAKPTSPCPRELSRDRNATPTPGPGRVLSIDVPHAACRCSLVDDRLLAFRQKHRLMHVQPGDLRRFLSGRDPSEHLELLVELLSLFDAPPNQAAAITGPSLYNVLSDLTLPQPHVSSRLEEGEDAAGFCTVNGYTIIGEAGRGTYGTVKIATTASGELRAIKVVQKERFRRGRVVNNFDQANAALGARPTAPDRDLGLNASVSRELNLMKRLRHRNIVHLYEVIDDPDEDLLYLVMPFIERGPLLNVSPAGCCEPLDIDVCRGYLRQLVEALLYLHQRRIVHLDIKPDNILLGGDGRVYLSDFGVSQMLRNEEEAVDRITGTPAFTAPECFGREGGKSPTSESADANTRRIVGKALDVWALGVTFYLMALGRLPFNGTTFREMSLAVTTCQLEFPPLLTFARTTRSDYAEAFDLLGQMLTKDPAMRLTLNGCHRHPFLRRATAAGGSTDSSAEAIHLPSPGRAPTNDSPTAVSGLRDSPFPTPPRIACHDDTLNSTGVSDEDLEHTPPW